MRRLTVAVSAALCLLGTSSLALAEEGTKYGDQMEPTGKLSQEPSVLGNKREPVRAEDIKREPVPDDAMKGEKVPPRTYSGEGARYGDQMEPTGKLSQEPSVLGNKREPVRPNEAMKGKKTEQKEKTKAHKDAPKTAPAAPAPAP